MKYLLRILLLIVFLGMVPIACEKCDSSECECETNDYKDSEIMDMDIFRINVYTFNRLDSFTAYSPDTIGLLLETTKREVVSNNSSQHYGLFTSQLMACSPLPPAPINNISEISIIATSPFSLSLGDTIDAGQEISDMFEYSSQGGWNDKTFAIESFRDIMRIRLSSQQIVEQPTVINFALNVELIDGKKFSFPDIQFRLKEFD